ncbi:hypothetical protein P3X46_017290 [Hevea brasiliensis]|nr:uncharacterized protein LOC110652461 isoform X2 [Hevea brasiliensis]KAJ9174244.1 hypothetical protein P3X46_017290 [Hevea brasiliensis]
MTSSDPKAPESATHIPSKDELSKETTNSSIGTQNPDESDQETKPTEEEEEEEEGECGFCLFMKGGGCRDVFIDWENCIKEADTNKENVVDKCFDATAALRKCMQAHADYYEPILRVEKDAEEKFMKELENEKASEGSESNVAEEETEIVVDSKDSTNG